jgi:hypothetical protein
MPTICRLRGMVHLRRHLLLVWPALLAACCYLVAMWTLLETHLASLEISGVVAPPVVDGTGVLTSASAVAVLTCLGVLAWRPSHWCLPALAALLHLWLFSRIAAGSIGIAVLLAEWADLSFTLLLSHPVMWLPTVTVVLVPIVVAPIAALHALRLYLSRTASSAIAAS